MNPVAQTFSSPCSFAFRHRAVGAPVNLTPQNCGGLITSSSMAMAFPPAAELTVKNGSGLDQPLFPGPSKTIAVRMPLS